MGVVIKGQPELTNNVRVIDSCKMKVFAVLLLASYALAHGGDNYHMFKTWSKTKAMESCWGEDNMKIYTVNMKKAIAKCNQVDAPELELPPYRSVDRFVNVMLSFARQMESNQFDQLYKMMGVINENQYDRRHNDYTYSRPERYGYENKMDNFQMMMKFKKMMNNMKNDDSFMNNDMMSFDWMKNKYNMPSVWFKNRYEEILDTCHEVATNLPEKLNKQEIVSGEFGTVNMGQIKSFMSCCKNAKQKLCMNQDIKNKIESNFGPVDEILESFNYQITEDQLFTQVNQLLQGSEDEYM